MHLRSLGPKPSMLLLHYALVAPANVESAGDLVRVETEDHAPWNVFPLEIGGLEGACTFNLPADNGALC